MDCRKAREETLGLVEKELTRRDAENISANEGYLGVWVDLGRSDQDGEIAPQCGKTDHRNYQVSPQDKTRKPQKLYQDFARLMTCRLDRVGQLPRQ